MPPQANASCLPLFNWMDNSMGQSPCLLAAYLQGACNGGEWTVNPLPPKTQYTGPDQDEQNPCQCSSVTYNVLSACGLCQNHGIVSWSTWHFSCSTVYPGVFPPGVPDGTAIPQWAFQDVTESNKFNVTLAQSVGDSSESTATLAQSTGSALPSTLTSSSSAVASLTPAPTVSSSRPSSSKTNTGEIVGSVVGGVAGVALLAGLVAFFVMKRKRSRTPPLGEFADAQVSPPFSSAAYADTTPFATQMVQLKLYDPDDPSTFPDSSSPPSPVRTGSSHDVPSSPHYPIPPVRPGSYIGTPEI